MRTFHPAPPPPPISGKLNITLDIKKLWHEEDNFHLSLYEDVTILSGENGSGKSTILRILYTILTGNNKLKSSAVYQNGDFLYYEIADFEAATLEVNGVKDSILDSNINDTSNISLHLTNKVDFFSSLDNEAISREDIQAIARQKQEVKSELDIELYNIQVIYTKYLLFISREIEKAYTNNEKIAEKRAQIYAPKLLFFDMIDNLFQATNKKIDREADELQFIKGGKTLLSVYHLSSGEKQILLILLKILLQNQKPALFLLDEPEISLHPDWQECLIDNILKINPNVQLVIATHSPDIIVNGWGDKVLDMKDLVQPLTFENTHGA